MELDPDACYRALATRDARFDGRFFTGVRTTGIYCRPVCPARTPRRENVRFFGSAAAAEAAGFRSCLRCRPESSPDLAAWRGTSNTVSRALALIAEGGLDGAAVDTLAFRLGLGERQLRRLFRQHLGASPVAVAQTRRVLFARQLLTETAMPLADVALAAGFGSVRRFNATFRALYGSAPGALRRAGQVAAAEPSGITLTLPYAPPYDWAAMADFLAARAIDQVERMDDAGRYHRSVALGGARGTVSIAHDAQACGLRATIRFPAVAALATLVGRIRRVFDLGADPLAIGRHLAADRLLAPLAAARPGLRVPGGWDGFELAVRAVLGQQVSVRAAARLAGRLVAAHGAPLDGGGPAGLARVFPEPAALLQLDAVALGMPRARARTIETLAAAALRDPGLFRAGRSLDETVGRLVALPGIGEWTAHYIALRAAREPDAFPASDAALLRVAARLTGTRPNPAGLAARAEAWRPWRAYAAQHLWAADAAHHARAASAALAEGDDDGT